jgi:hypothetical protein
LVELSALRNCELEIPVLLEVGGGGIRIVLNRIFLADHQLVAIRLKHEKPQRDIDGFGIRRGLVNCDVNIRRARRERLVKKDVLIHGADQHGALADSGMIEMKLAVGVRFCVGDHLHATHQLDEQNVDVRGDLVAVRAVVHDAGYGSRAGGDRNDEH